MALDLRVPVETKTQEVFTADAFDLVARERVVRVPESLSLEGGRVDGGRDEREDEKESIPWPVILDKPEDPVMESSGSQASSGNDGYEDDDEASTQGMRCVSFEDERVEVEEQTEAERDLRQER